jgi:hypothetical protein
MALFGDREDRASNAKLEAMVDLLQTENDRLHKQVNMLQEAIISKLAPLAYAEMKADEIPEGESSSNAEQIREMEEQKRIYSEYAARIEEPFFSSADDMIDKLSAAVGFPKPGETSLHGNDES